MSDSLPDPFVPMEVDITGLPYMPYYGDRLRESDLNSRATDGEYRAAHNLWWSAWKQHPAGSLPADDVILCRLADLGRDQKTWMQVKERSMHGFVLCADGRFYHEFLAELVLQAWNARVIAATKGRNGASKRWAKHGHKDQLPQADMIGSGGNATAIEKDSKRSEVKGREVKADARSGKPDVKILVDLGVDEQVAIDWLKVRKAKRAPLTDTVIRNIQGEAEKAGITFPQAIAICARRSWQGFDSTWNWQAGAPQQGAGGMSRQASLEQRNREVADNWKPPEESHA